MANIKGFTYSLSVDEKKSLSNLKTSIGNIQQKSSNLSIPVNLKINTTIPRETLNSAKEALKKKNLSLSVDLKINAKSITNSTIAEAQKLLNEKNKQLAMTVGLKIDNKALNNVKQINDVFKETKNTLDEIVKDISKLAGVKLQIFEGVDSNGVSTSRTKTRPSNTSDLQKEIDFQQTSLQLLLEKLKTQKAYESILNDPIESERLRLLQERVNALGLEARTIAEVKEEVRDLKQEYNSIAQGGKLILWQDDQIAKGKQYYENLEKANKALQEEIKKQQETLQARYRSMSQMSQIKVLANEERMAWENVGKAINSLDGKSIDEVREKARQIKLEMTNIKTDGVEKLNSSWQKLKTTLISIPAQYVSVYTAIRTAEAVFKSATSHIMEVDQAYTNMSMTMQSMSKDTFNGMLSQINAMSKGMGAVSGEVLKIAQTFANDNTSITEVIDKLQSSIALMNVSGMEATEVTKSIMSIANSYQMLADDGSNAAEVTEYLGDVLTKTSANMAMDFTKLLVTHVEIYDEEIDQNR